MNPGDTVEYTLTATNNSGAVLTGAVVTDDLTDVLDNATIGPIGTGGSLSGTTLTWVLPTLDPGEVATLSYEVTVNAGAFNQSLGNVATPGPGGVCVLPANCDTVHPTPGYTLAKSSDPVDGATVNPGDVVEYTLTVTNNSGGVLTGAVVTDDLSDVLDNATMGTIGAGGTLAGTTLTWAVPTLQPGTSATLSYEVTVDADAFNETLVNVATPGPGGECVAAPAVCTTSHPTPHYVLTKSSDPASGETVVPGDVVEYTLTVTNDSDAVLTGAVVTDDLSDVLDNATMGTIGAGGTLDEATDTLTWAVPTLQPGTSATLTYEVTVNAGAFNETLVNVATPGAGGECAAAPAVCSTTHPTPGYTLVKSSDPASGETVVPGDVVEYTLTVTNDSDGVLTGAVVTDDLSDVLDNATLGTIGTGGSVTGTTLTWMLPTLQPGTSATLVYEVTVNADAFNQTLVNVATPGPGGECAAAPAVCTTSHPTPHYLLAKSSDPASGETVVPGDDVEYTLTVTNDSDGVLTGAVVTDDLSDVLANAEIGTIGTGGSLTGTTLTWTVPTLAPAGVATLVYTVTVDADAFNQTLVNVATPGPGTGGECAAAPAVCTTTHPTPHYLLAKSSDPASGETVNPGDTISTH